MSDDFDDVERVFPEHSFNTLILNEDVERTLKNFLREWKHRTPVYQAGLKPRSRLILVGPPGCGKTSIAHAMASDLKLELYYVQMEYLLDSALGQSPEAIARVFKKLNKKKIVILFDEMDMIATRRVYCGKGGASSEMARVTNALLRGLDAYEGEAVIIGSTNMHEDIDKAVWRRFDDVLYIPMPVKRSTNVYLN